jgi:uncharacterized protein (TIGR03545 family)
MRKWLRWQFVVPRLLALIVATLAVQYVMGVIVRSIAVQSGEAATGAQVEVGHARVSLLNRQVVLSDVRVASRQKSTENALEADRCELKLAAAPALHQRAVIESGRISGLRLNGFTETTSSSRSAATAATSSAWFKADVDLAARKWLQRLNEQFTLDAVKDFDSVARTESFCANWSAC